MSRTATEWNDEYQHAKEKLLQLRTGGGSRDMVASVSQAIDRLEYRLGLMEQNPSQFQVHEAELVKRRELVKGLRTSMTQFRSTSSSGTYPPGGQGTGGVGSGAGGGSVGPRTAGQMRKDLIAEQDDLLEDLSRGVDRLKQHGLNIKEETELHKRLLDDIDGDVEAAASSLKLEARHAERIREQTSVCRLYICIAVLVAILVLLLIVGFS